MSESGVKTDLGGDWDDCNPCCGVWVSAAYTLGNEEGGIVVCFCEDEEIIVEE